MQTAISEYNVVKTWWKLDEETFYCLNILYSPGLISTSARRCASISPHCSCSTQTPRSRNDTLGTKTTQLRPTHHCHVLAYSLLQEWFNMFQSSSSVYAVYVGNEVNYIWKWWKNITWILRLFYKVHICGDFNDILTSVTTRSQPFLMCHVTHADDK
jgi:hypothetical protein